MKSKNLICFLKIKLIFTILFYFIKIYIIKINMSDLIFFNVADGYAEALLRGFRKTFLAESTYAAIRNSNSLKDLKGVIKNNFFNQNKIILFFIFLGFNGHRLHRLDCSVQ
jgi:hypothetical protein